jgi:hypothetical protein
MPRLRVEIVMLESRALREASVMESRLRGSKPKLSSCEGIVEVSFAEALSSGEAVVELKRSVLKTESCRRILVFASPRVKARRE